MIVGGDPAIFAAHLPVLEAIGGRVFHVGLLGSASVLKVITNMLAFIHLVAAGEALMLARRGGLDLAQSFEVIKASSGTSFVHETESQVILNGSYDIGFTLDLACKDLGFAHDLGDELGVPLELATLVEQTFSRAREEYGGDAWSPMAVKLLEDAVGTDLRRRIAGSHRVARERQRALSRRRARRSGYCAHFPPTIAPTRLRQLLDTGTVPLQSPVKEVARNDRHDHRKLLTLGEVVRVARGQEQVDLHADVAARMITGRAVVEDIVSAGSPVYGLTTGVAARKRHRLAPEDQPEHNRLMIDSLFMGQGPPTPEDVVRATILLLTNGFAAGTAGVRPLLVDRLVAALNDGEAVSVGIHGSLGMADLAPMAELARAVLGDLELAAKEAVSLVDNNASSTAIASLAIHDLERLLDAFDAAAALDLEAFGSESQHPAPGCRRGTPLSGCGARDRPPPNAPRRQLSLGGGERAESAGPAQLSLHPSGARSSPRGARLRAATARDRAERITGEPARRPRGEEHHLGRQLRSDHPGRRARLPPAGVGTRRHVRVRTADQAHAGSCFRAPGGVVGPTGLRDDRLSAIRLCCCGDCRRGPLARRAGLRTICRRRALRRESKTG